MIRFRVHLPSKNSLTLASSTYVNIARYRAVTQRQLVTKDIRVEIDMSHRDVFSFNLCLYVDHSQIQSKVAVAGTIFKKRWLKHTIHPLSYTLVNPSKY